MDRDAEAFAAEHQPDDAELPILEAVQVRVRVGVEINQWAGGDEGFAATVAGREKEGDVGDLLGERVDGAVNPNNLFISTGEDRAGIFILVASEPGCGSTFTVELPLRT